MDLHLFELDDDGEAHHIVATTAEEALRYAKDDYEIPPKIPGDDEPDFVTAKQVPDEQLLTVTMQDETVEQVTLDIANGVYPTVATQDGKEVTAPAGEWAKSGGLGFLVSTTVY